MSHSREVNASLRYALLRNVPKPTEGLFYPWNIDFVSRDQDRLLSLGWAAPLDGLPDNTVICCDGRPTVGTWSSDETYDRLLPNWHGAADSGFRAAWPDFVISDDDVLTFEVRAADGGELPEKHELKFRFADQAIIKCPDESLIAHIGRLTPMSFVLTGRTLATHFDRLLRSFSGSGFGGAQSVLDWGCGSARVAQHVAQSACAKARR